MTLDIGRIVKGESAKTINGACPYCFRPTPGYPMCEKHEDRNERYGSPTAMRCKKCKKVFDNAYTAEISNGQGWLCIKCSDKFCELDTCNKKLKNKRMRYCSRSHLMAGKKIEQEEREKLKKMAIEYGIHYVFRD